MADTAGTAGTPMRRRTAYPVDRPREAFCRRSASARGLNQERLFPRTGSLRGNCRGENDKMVGEVVLTSQREIPSQGLSQGRFLAIDITAQSRAHPSRGQKIVAALYVSPCGVYSGLPSIDLWDEARDARTYCGPWPVVAHSPCQRWGRFWHGSTRKPHQYRLGDDGGCFAAALAAVRRFGGVLEHPADSHAWRHFGLNRPPRAGGWGAADFEGGWTCHVEQGHYGHFSRKPTWLYAHGVELPELTWGASPQRLHPIALERYGYAKARRIGMAAMIGGKRKTEIREATPVPFRDVLLSIALSAALPYAGGAL